MNYRLKSNEKLKVDTFNHINQIVLYCMFILQN